MNATQPTQQGSYNLAKLHQLANQACTSVNFEIKQRSFAQLQGYYVDGSFTPQILFHIFTGSRLSLDTTSWHITCFTLMEILFETVDKIGKQSLYGFYQMMIRAMERMFDKKDKYSRVLEMANKITAKGQKVSLFLVNSIKRTLCMTMKYLTKYGFPIYSLLPFKGILPSSETNPNLTSSEKFNLHFYFEIFLAFIKQLPEKNTKMELIDQMRIIECFQAKVIIHLIELMPSLINTIDHEIEMSQLESNLNTTLQIDEQASKNMDQSSHEVTSSMQIELSLSVIEAMIYFPYLLNDPQWYANRPAVGKRNLQDKQKEQQIVGVFVEPIYRYPKEISLLFCSKMFIDSLFTLAKKILAFIRHQLQHMYAHGNPKVQNIHKNKIFSYLYYYRLIMQYLTRIAATDIQFSNNRSLAQILIQEQATQMNISDTDWGVRGNFVSVILANFIQIMEENLQELIVAMDKILIGSQGWNFLRELTLRLEQATVSVACRLIQNIQIPDILAQTRLNDPKTNKKYSVSQRYNKICQILLKTTKRHILLTQNITLPSILAAHSPITLTPPQSTNSFLRHLFNFWHHIMKQKQQINMILKYRLACVLANNEDECSGTMSEEVQNTSSDLSKTQNYICEVINTLVDKVCQQQLPILSETAKSKGSSEYKLIQLNQQLSTILRFSKHFIKSCRSQYLIKILTNIQNKITVISQKIGQSLILNNPNLTLPIFNNMYNLILLTKYLLIQTKMDQNLAKRVKYQKHQQSTYTINKLFQQILACISQFTPVGNQLKYQLANPSQYYNDQVLVLYLSGHCKYRVTSISNILDGYRKAVRDKQENFQITPISNNSFVNQYVQMFRKSVLVLDEMMRKKYLTRIKHCIYQNHNQDSQFPVLLELCTDIIKIFDNLTENIKVLLKQYRSIVNLTKLQEQTQIPKHSVLELQTFMMGIVWTNILEIKDSYTNQYLEYCKLGTRHQEIVRKFGCVMELYESLVKVFSFIQFYELKDVRQNVSNRVQEYIEYVIHSLEFNSVRSLISPYNNNKAKDKKSELAIQFSIINLTAIYQSFTKQIKYSKIPSLFLLRLQKYIPINQLMAGYIIQHIRQNKYELNQDAHKKIYNLLRLSKFIITGISYEIGLTPKGISSLSKFVGDCVPFWSGLLGYIQLLYRNRVETKGNIIERFQDLLMVMFQVFMALLKNNTYYPPGNLNFCALGRLCPQFDSFIQLFLRVLVIVYTHKGPQATMQGQSGKESITYFPELKKLADTCSVKISVGLTEFILDYKAHKFGNQVVLQQCQYFMPAFTHLFIIKAIEFTEQARKASAKKNTQYLDKENIKQEETELYLSLNTIKAVLAYVRRGLLYTHNKPLQNNIRSFIQGIHNTGINLKDNEQQNSLVISPPLQVPLELALVFWLVKFGLAMVQQGNSMSSYMVTACQTLGQLPPIIAEFDKIFSSSNEKKQGEALKGYCFFLFRKELGISEKESNQFQIIWQKMEKEEELVNYYEENQIGSFERLIRWFTNFYADNGRQRR